MTNGNIEPNQNIYSTPPSITPPPPSYSEETIPPKPKSKKIKIVIGVIIGILLVSIVGATVALYTRAWDPLWNPFRPEPDKVIQEMTQRMKSIKTIHSETKINAEIKDEDGSADISMSFNSNADTADPKNQKSAGDFNLAFSTKSISSYGPDEISFSLGGEAKVLGNISYFKLNPLSAMIVDYFRNETEIDLNELFNNKWINIDPESISNSIEELLKIYFKKEVIPFEEDEMASEIIDEIFGKQVEMQKDLQEKVKKMMEGKKFFIVRKELPDTEINEVKMYHYIMTIDKNELKRTIPDFAIIYFDIIKSIIPFPMTDEEEYEAKKQINDELNKTIDEFFSKVGDIEGEVWIGKKDYLLYKVDVGKVIDLNKINQYSKGTINFKVDMNFSNFDKPVVIEAPKDSIDIIEILIPIIEESLVQARKRAGDAYIKANLSMVGPTAEMISDDFDSYENLCTEPPAKKINRVVANYGTDLGYIEDSIKTKQGGILDLVCLDSVTSYCIVSGLPSGGKYCVDSSFATVEIQKNQTCVGSGTSQNPYKCPPHSTPIMP